MNSNNISKYFLLSNKVYIEKEKEETSLENNNIIILGVQTELARFGYTLDEECIEALSTKNTYGIAKFLVETIINIKNLLKLDVDWKPLFLGFPTKVPDDEEYFIKRIFGIIENILKIDGDENKINEYDKLDCGHYINRSLFNIDEFGACPICQKQTLQTSNNKQLSYKELDETTPLRVLKCVSSNDIKEHFEELIYSKSSIPLFSKEFVKDYIMFTKGSINKNKLVSKENIALINKILLEKTKDEFEPHIENVTDILRLATVLSDDEADLTLKDNTKYKLKNRYRNLILKLLNVMTRLKVNDKCNYFVESLNLDILEDMKRHREKWLRLGEHIHPGTKKKRFPFAYDAFKMLRNNENSIKSFDALLEAQEDIFKTIDLLKTRPTEFARRLRFYLCWYGMSNVTTRYIISSFIEVVESVPTLVLLNLHNKLQDSYNQADFRYFIPRGNTSKIYFKEGSPTYLDPDITKPFQDVINETLSNRFSALSKYNNITIDPELKNYTIPTQLRSASKALNTVGRGSQISMNVDESKTIRMFIYWKENKKSNRVDVDLSAIGFDSNWNKISHISYTDLKNGLGIHSGDIQSAPNGAAEYIDINISKAKELGYRYVMLDVKSYTGQSFNSFECSAGFMEREHPNKGEFLEAKTIKTKFDITMDSTGCIPVIFDLEEMRMIWCDMASIKGAYRNVENSIDKLEMVGKTMTRMIKDSPNLYDLLYYHQYARIENRKSILDVDLEENNKIHYGVEFAQEYSKILSEYL